MGKYIMALDQGTTSSRTILFDKKGRIIAQANKEFEQIFPNPGWVEHNPEEIWMTQLLTMEEVMKESGATGEDIEAIGITNQRETTVVWDKDTGKPIYKMCIRDRIKEALANLDGNAAMDKINAGEPLTFDFDGNEVVLEKEDLLIDMAQVEGYVSESDGNVTVVLDTNLSEELIEEGFVREVISLSLIHIYMTMILSALENQM